MSSMLWILVGILVITMVVMVLLQWARVRGANKMNSFPVPLVFTCSMGFILGAISSYFNIFSLYPGISVGVFATGAALAFIYTILTERKETSSERAGRAYEEFPEDPLRVTIGVSKYTLGRKPFQVFVNDKKVAMMHRGNEMRIAVPEGACEVTVYQNKWDRFTKTIHMHDRIGLFIWQGVGRPSTQITPVYEGRATFEEESRAIYQRRMRFMNAGAAVFAAVSILTWLTVAFWPAFWA